MNIPPIAQTVRSSEFRQYMVDLLVELCRVDTGPNADVAVMRLAEAKAFDIIERHLATYGLQGGQAVRKPINPRIDQHPFYSLLHFTKTPQRPQGLTPEETYKDRCNLLFLLDGDKADGPGVDQAVNAHVDVIAPYIPPRVEGDTVFGRGACDDKGPVVAMMGALKLVGGFLKTQNRRLGRNFTGMFVVEEETGGNGSLALALDRQLKERYQSIMVLECCQCLIHPGNRGAVWYKVEGAMPGVNLFEASAFIIQAMESEGRALKAESNHPLFPHRPVQTCHGIIGRNGQHPSRINGDVSFHIVCAGGDLAKARRLIQDILADGLAQYLGVYGDKSKIIDPQTGKPKVDHHQEATWTGRDVKVRVLGSTGHMGSIMENDGAITKMATLVRSLIRSRPAIEAQAGGKVRFELDDWDDQSHLVLEGGQGFLPTHPMEQVQQRMREAVWRGAENYLCLMGAAPEVVSQATLLLEMSYNKLHNAAFAGSADSPDMQNAIAAAKGADMWKDQPVRGWDVSCDARIFACEYPGLPVLTSGPGQLAHAHSDFEQLHVPELLRFTEFLAYFILKQTGTAE